MRKDENNQVAAERAESGRLVFSSGLHSRSESRVVINQIWTGCGGEAATC